MHCPYRHHDDSRVVDSRTADDGAAIRRRRQCPECSRRFTTVETAALQVQKRSGVPRAFSVVQRSRLVFRKACQGRPVSEDDWRCSPRRSRMPYGPSGNPEIPAHEVGMAILGPLRKLDEVAYLRFASVYRSFESLEDFEAEVALLRMERESGSDLMEGTGIAVSVPIASVSHTTRVPASPQVSQTEKQQQSKARKLVRTSLTTSNQETIRHRQPRHDGRPLKETKDIDRSTPADGIGATDAIADPAGHGPSVAASSSRTPEVSSDSRWLTIERLFTTLWGPPLRRR